MTDLPDEETVPVRRGRRVGADPADPGLPDATSTGTTSSGSAQAGTATVRSPAAAEGPRSRRATYVEAGDDRDDATVGSTFVARRETRRRAAREQRAADATAAAPSPAAPLGAADPAHPGRVASAPDPDASAYGPRAPHPVIAARSAPPVRRSQSFVDGAAAVLAQRRKARRRAVIVAIAASALVVGAAGSLLALALIP